MLVSTKPKPSQGLKRLKFWRLTSIGECLNQTQTLSGIETLQNLRNLKLAKYRLNQTQTLSGIETRNSQLRSTRLEKCLNQTQTLSGIETSQLPSPTPPASAFCLNQTQTLSGIETLPGSNSAIQLKPRLNQTQTLSGIETLFDALEDTSTGTVSTKPKPSQGLKLAISAQ